MLVGRVVVQKLGGKTTESRIQGSVGERPHEFVDRNHLKQSSSPKALANL